MTRIVICGGPRTGKTTLAKQLLKELAWTQSGSDPPADGHGFLRHTDDLIALGWSQSSEHVAREWLTQPGPWIIEGVAASRALRKWREAHPDEPPPVDKIIRLTTPHVELSARQVGMAKGEEHVWQEIAGWLYAEPGMGTVFVEIRGERAV